jgi:hypothetical protein
MNTHASRAYQGLIKEGDVQLNDLTLGSSTKRLGVMLLSLVQQLNGNDINCHLYLQTLKQTFTYRRYIRLGFQYSMLHSKNDDGILQSSWPECKTANDLPLNLREKVDELKLIYSCGDCRLRLLVLKDPLREFYPPTEKFGSPAEMKDPRALAMFDKWRFRCMLPDPIPEMSCNHSCHKRTLIDLIQKAFLQEGGTYGPNIISDHKKGELVENADEVASALSDDVETIDHGVGLKMNHLDSFSQPLVDREETQQRLN